MTFTHDSYTVAWICALPLELAAAKVVLDGVHPRLLQPKSDHNVYTLGSISGHNVVVVCLPVGVYGTTSATAAVAHLKSTYPSIQFGLMVGIGGGVPGGNPDIRLWRYCAITQMESDSMLGQVSLSDIIASKLQTKEVRKQFPRPSKDELFQSTYDHVGDSSNCSACDRNKLVDRPERTMEEPHIHYGLIASGNQVMKDARAPAGLMDEIPSLVIRGICDYCDSHKHKEWQAYAAFVTAAYAKTVLYGSRKRHWMVPFYRNLGFVGREEEIAKVEEFIKFGQPKIAICGLGGMGKTQIALELAYRICETDPRCSIFWIPCTSYASVEQAYMSIAQTIGMQAMKPAEVKKYVKTYFSQRNGQKWLLVCDNADDMDMWFGGCILFTTRNRKLAMKLASSFVIHVSELDAEAGLKILERTLIRQDLLDDNKATITLLEQLVFLPLAITQAAAYINSNDIKLSDYTALLQEQERDVIELLSEDFEDHWRYKEIPNPIRQQDRLAAEYLAFMACISPRDIPQSLLPAAASNKERIDAVSFLKACSFVAEQVQDHALSLHRLVYLSTRNWLRKQRQFSLQIHKTAAHFCHVFPIGERDFQEERENYLELVRDIGRCLRTDGRYNEAAVLFEDIVKLKERAKSDPSTSILITMSDLASTYWNQGRWKEAEKLDKQAMEIRKQVLGPEHPETLLRTMEEAEELEVPVLPIRKRVLGPEHPDALFSMANIACTYRYQGRWKEAEELEVQVLPIRERVLGPEHPDTLRSMANLAYT
ncbi:nucleoside phosphorylase domain-containing protein [Aspergillus spectabilis]